MADPPAPPARRRRADAQRSIDAIVGAARALLVERPDAGMEEIAEAAGVSRQTVYSHFSSRDVLVAAVVNAERARSLAALGAVDFRRMEPVAAVREFLRISWQLADRVPLLLDVGLARIGDTDGGDPHGPPAAVLEGIVRRGQRTGAFDRQLPAAWLVTATFALGHAVGEQVAAGTLGVTKAARLLDQSVLRLYGVRVISAQFHHGTESGHAQPAPAR